MGLCKTYDPWGGAIFDPIGYNLNNFGSGLLDKATYQILKDLGHMVLGKKILKVFAKFPLFVARFLAE